MKFLSNLEFNTTHHILLNSTNPYRDLKQKLTEKLISSHLTNQQIHPDYLQKLTFKINTKFSMSVADKLLHSIKTIDNFREFERLLDFADKI